MSKKKKRPRPKSRKSSKRPKHKPSDTQSLPKRERKQLEALFEAQEWDALGEAFSTLKESYPKAPELYAIMCFVAQEVRDSALLAHGAYHWQRYAPHHPDALALWAHVALNDMRPGHAMRALQTLTQLWPDHEEAPNALAQINALSAIWDSLLDDMGLSQRDDALQLMCYHEDAQIALEEERFGEALSISKQVISRMPSFAAAHNTAALAQFSMGKIEDALETSEAVLDEHDPNNIHALSNSIHFLVLLDRFDEAETRATTLASCDLSSPYRNDLFVKKAEGLSYIDYHDDILACLEEAHVYAQSEYERLRDDDDVEDAPNDAEEAFEGLPRTGLLCHLAAVAAAHLGDEPEARRLWKRALQIEPELKTADDNLAELDKPAHQRYAPWAFAIYNWLPLEMLSSTLPLLNAIADEGQLEWDVLKELAPLLDDVYRKYPTLKTAAPHLLGLVGPEGQELLRLIMLASQKPDQLDYLAEFAMGPSGPDAERAGILKLLMEVGHLKRGEKRVIWAQGQQVEQLLLGYRLDREPPEIPDELVDALHGLSTSLVARGSAGLAESEAQLDALLEAHPTTPAVVNMAITVAHARGDSARSKALSEQLLEAHPEATLARCSLALIELKDGYDDEAQALVEPLLSQASFDPQSLQMLCEIQIELQLRKGDNTAAIQWLTLAMTLLPGDPSVARLRKKFGLWARIKRWFRPKPKPKR